MPYKNKERAREYKRLWIAKKRSRQNVEPEPNVEPKPNVEPLKKGWALAKCPVCPRLVPMEKKHIPYFAKICSSECLNKIKEEERSFPS